MQRTFWKRKCRPTMQYSYHHQDASQSVSSTVLLLAKAACEQYAAQQVVNQHISYPTSSRCSEPLLQNNLKQGKVTDASIG
jgi:hypothetical protein